MTPSVDTGMSPPTQQTYGEVLLLKTYMSMSTEMFDENLYFKKTFPLQN